MQQIASKSITEPSPQVEVEKLPQIVQFEDFRVIRADRCCPGAPLAHVPPVAQIAGLCACMGQSAAMPQGSVHPQWPSGSQVHGCGKPM